MRLRRIYSGSTLLPPHPRLGQYLFLFFSLWPQPHSPPPVDPSILSPYIVDPFYITTFSCRLHIENVNLEVGSRPPRFFSGLLYRHLFRISRSFTPKFLSVQVTPTWDPLPVRARLFLPGFLDSWGPTLVLDLHGLLPGPGSRRPLPACGALRPRTPTPCLWCTQSPDIKLRSQGKAPRRGRKVRNRRVRDFTPIGTADGTRTDVRTLLSEQVLTDHSCRCSRLPYKWTFV